MSPLKTPSGFVKKRVAVLQGVYVPPLETHPPFWLRLPGKNVETSFKSYMGYLKAEILDGFHKVRGVFLGGGGVDAVPEVHHVVTPPTVAKDLLRTLLFIGVARRHQSHHTKEWGYERIRDRGLL